MAGVGIFLILMGYTLIYAGVKNVSAMGEISYGLGLGPDPFISNSTTEEQAQAEVVESESLWDKLVKYNPLIPPILKP